jgi:hypothetical protein
MTAANPSDPRSSEAAPRGEDRRRPGPSTSPEAYFDAYDDGSFPASDAPGRIPETTIVPPSRERAVGADHSPSSREDRPRDADPRRIVASESGCGACGVRTVRVYHEAFAGMCVEARDAEEAVGYLVNRLGAAIGTAIDPAVRDAVRSALADARAFLEGVNYARPVRDVTARHRASRPPG